jgi:CBS domain-containing protein
MPELSPSCKVNATKPLVKLRSAIQSPVARGGKAAQSFPRRGWMDAGPARVVHIPHLTGRAAARRQMRMTVSAILKTKGADVISVNPSSPLSAVVETLASRRIGAVLVLHDDGRVAGVLSERDVVRALARHGSDALAMSASSFMTEDVISASPEDSIGRVMEKMTHGRFRHLPIVDQGHLVGIISIGDVVKMRIDEAEHEAQALRDYVTQAG